MSTKSSVKITVPIFEMIGLCLVIAKLGGIDPIASWSWWLVTLPFWFGIVVVIAFLAIFLLVAAIVFILSMLFAFLMDLFGK